MIVLGLVLSVFVMTIQSYDTNKGTNTPSCMTIRSYNHTRSVLRPIYYLTIVLG